MPFKRLLFKSAAREKVLKGATALTEAVRVTLGPKSKCVLIEKKWGRPIVCNDGVTIAKEIEFEDPEENLGARMIREAAERTGDAVGDGTSTSAILAHAIFAEGLHNVAAGASAVELKRGLDRGLRVCRPGIARPFPSCCQPPGEGTDCNRVRPQRLYDWRIGRRRDGEGRKGWGGHHRRGKDNRNSARSSRRHAV